jgi:hypothetical protein
LLRRLGRRRGFAFKADAISDAPPYAAQSLQAARPKRVSFMLVHAKLVCGSPDAMRQKIETYSCEVCQRAFPCDRQGACQRARLLPEANQKRQIRLLCKDCYLKITNTKHLYRGRRPRQKTPPQHDVQ